MRYEVSSIHSGQHTQPEYLREFHIAVRDVPNHPTYPEHTHEFTELVVVYEGGGINCVNEFEWRISAGDVFIIHPGQTHAYKQTHQLHLVNVLFDRALHRLKGSDIVHLPGYHALFMLDPSLLGAKTVSHMHLQPSELTKAKVIIDELESEVDTKKPGYRLISQSLLLLLIGKLSRWYTPQATDESQNLSKISDAIAHIEATFYEPLSIQTLARLAGLSERTFYRVFQNATGATPNQYLVTLRLSHVAELLRHSDMSITNIAFECGFQDSSYMAKQFKAHFGMTPRHFRMAK